VDEVESGKVLRPNDMTVAQMAETHRAALMEQARQDWTKASTAEKVTGNGVQHTKKVNSTQKI